MRSVPLFKKEEEQQQHGETGVVMVRNRRSHRGNGRVGWRIPLL